MNLVITILTSGLKDNPRYPKVCYKIGDKTMLEIVLEQVIQLNPTLIILLVEKKNIIPINNAIKYATYAKLISYSIFDYKKDKQINLAKHCGAGKNMLVIPGNLPLLTTKCLYKIVSEYKSVRIRDNIYYLKKEDIDKLDRPELIKEDKTLINEKELLQVETKEQFDKAIKKLAKK